MSNIEQGISNDEVKPQVLFPSVFDIHYSTCPLCPQTDFTYISSMPVSIAASVATQSIPQARGVFCGSLLTINAACAEVTDLDSNSRFLRREETP
jgi:hypothetical protein